MAKVEIYTKYLCPYCSRALSILKSKGAEIEETDITLSSSKRAEMVERSGGRLTVPQIFIDGRNIGGCDDLMDFDAEGKLDAALAR